MKFKTSEPLETQIKRQIINGMTYTAISQLHRIKKSKVITVNSEITSEDVKKLKGTPLVDCVPPDLKKIIIDMLANGKTTKSISQQTQYPTKIINAIAEHRIVEALAKERKPQPIITFNKIGEVADTRITETHNIEVNNDTEVPTKKTKNNPDDDEIKELIVDEYRKGKTMKEISEEYGISMYYVSKYIHSFKEFDGKKLYHSCKEVTKKREPSTNPGALTKEQVLEISEYIIAGFTNSEICDMTGVDTGKISHIRCKRTYRQWTEDYEFTKGERYVPMFNSKMSKDTFYQIIDMLMQAYDNKEIARVTGYTEATINNIRTHKTYAALTKDKQFPAPTDKLYFTDVKPRTSNGESETDDIDPTVEESADNSESIVIDNVNEDLPEPSSKNVAPSFNTDEYYYSIAKAVAGDQYHIGAIIVKDATIISSARVDVNSNIDPIVIAMLHTSTELLRGSNAYVYNGKTALSNETLREIGINMG